MQTEVQVGSKRVDVYFEERRFGSFRRIAVEAKAYGRPLNNGDFEDIYGGYAALLKANEIDHIMVVSTYPLEAPAANGLLRTLSAEMTYHQLKDFQEEILSFQAFLGSFINRHERDGLERYYVRPLLSDGRDLLEVLRVWLDDNTDNGPIAIIAGYGMGKTSVARHLTYDLAKKFATGEDSRIPIYVSLGGISREQGLEGLIGTALTNGLPAVRNFSFPVFELLNEAGRFVVILDGFDEMKHMMSEAEFRANFDELNRLVTGRAKVLLLGRPTAFLSESEHAYVLRGSRRIGSQFHRTPGSPRYTELGLKSFAPAQVRSFLTNYFQFQRDAGHIQVDDAFAAKRIAQLESAEHEELIARPVHARMLADLASDPNFKISQLSRFELYDHFVAHLIDREGKKIGRGDLLKEVDRRAFSCDLAWHLWLDPAGATSGCRIEDIPDDVFDPYLPRDEDPLALRRALLSGSFLDEKAAGVFYFAHRSFQEFLVAEYIWSNLTDKGEDAERIAPELENAMTKEVFAFLIDRKDRQFFRTLLSELARNSCAFTFETFLVITNSAIMREIANGRPAAFITAWDIGTLLAHAMVHDRQGEEDMIKVARQLGERASHKPGVLLSAIRATLLLGAAADVPRETCARMVVAMLFARGDKDIEMLGAERRGGRMTGALRDSIFEAVSAVEDEGHLIMELDFDTLLEAAGEVSHQPIELVVYDRIDMHRRWRAEFDDFFDHLHPTDRHELRTFFKRDARLTRDLAMHRPERDDKFD